MKNNRNIELNESFWAFVKLVVSDDRYLSKEGLIIKEIVESGGYCKSIKVIARKLDIHRPTATYMCKKLVDDNIICLVRNKNSKTVRFSSDVIEEGIKIPYSIIGDRK